MSESEHREEPEAQATPPAQTSGDDEARDRLVGRYTEVEDDGPLERGVAGEYTRTEKTAEDESSVGDYVTTDADPRTHDPAERPGKYTRADHGKPRHDK